MTNTTIIPNYLNSTNWSDVNNNETDTNFPLPIDMQFNNGHRLSITGYSVLMVISAIGNLTVLILLIKRRLNGPSRIDVMLMHLAIADLLVTFLMMPFEIAWNATVYWVAGDLMCRVMAFFRTFGLYLSSFVLVCISVDRYFAVIKPMNLAGMDRRGKVMLSMAWIGSVICSAPQSIIFHVEHHPSVTWYEQCVTYHSFETRTQEVLYSVVGMTFMYALPLIIIVFCYVSIYYELYRKSRKCITDRFRRSNDDVLGRAKRKTLRMTITIVIVFVVCWTPYNVITVWFWIDTETAKNLDPTIQKGLFLFACTNSCMNPIVYGLYNIPRRKDKNNLRNSNYQRASISKRIECMDRRRSSVISNRTTTSLRGSLCVSCGDSMELSNLRKPNLYH